MLGRRRPRSSDTHSPHEPTPHNDTFTVAFLESTSLELEHGMSLVIAYAFQGNMTDPIFLSGKAQEVKPAAARPPKGANTSSPVRHPTVLTLSSGSPLRPPSHVYSATMRTRSWSSWIRSWVWETCPVKSAAKSSRRASIVGGKGLDHTSAAS